MDYEKIYYNLCKNAKKVPIRDRLYNRNNLDLRLYDDEIYTEKHHIIPKHDGGFDDIDNMVSLLPEEHFLAHLIRYKAFKQRGDFLSVRIIVNGYNSKKVLYDTISKIPFNKRIGLYKDMIVKFRKITGWQSEDGRNRISESRKGTFPVKDVKTGKIIGSVDKYHPNIINGKWVHHSKGKISVTDSDGNRSFIPVDEYHNNKDTYKPNISDCKGSKNPNFKEITQDRKERLFNLIPKSLDEGYIKVKELEINLKKEFIEFNKISIVWINNNFGSVEHLINEYNLIHSTNIKYSRYFKSKKTKNKLSNAAKKYCWVTNYKENKMIEKVVLNQFLKDNTDFKKGRNI